jgi:hypothetical protein
VQDALAAIGNRYFVVLYLDGGNDGLNTLIPVGDGRYRQLRARIGIDPATTLAVPGHPEFGWHPSLGGLKQLYDAGKVAVLPAVDYANPDQSHFNSQIFWRTGVVGATADRTGWLGRTVDAIGGSGNALQAVSIGTSLDPILLTRRAPVATIFDPGTFGFAIPGVPPRRDGPALRPYRGALHGARSPARKAAQRKLGAQFRRLPYSQDPVSPEVSDIEGRLELNELEAVTLLSDDPDRYPGRRTPVDL